MDPRLSRFTSGCCVATLRQELSKRIRWPFPLPFHCCQRRQCSPSPHVLRRRMAGRLSSHCGHLGLDLKALLHGDEGQIQRLAGYGGVDTRDLMNRTFRLSDDGLVCFRSERLALSAIHRRRVRACPECLSQDRAAGVGLASRPLWALVQARRCCCQGRIWSMPRRSFPTIFRQPGTSIMCRAQPSAATRVSRFGRKTASKNGSATHGSTSWISMSWGNVPR